MLEALLANAGYRTACYTSPHVLRYNERIRIDGLAASDDEIIAAFERVQVRARHDVAADLFRVWNIGGAGRVRRFRCGHADPGSRNGRPPGRGQCRRTRCLSYHEHRARPYGLAWQRHRVNRPAKRPGSCAASKPAVFGTVPDVPNAITEYAAEVGADLRLAGAGLRIPEERRRGIVVVARATTQAVRPVAHRPWQATHTVSECGSSACNHRSYGSRAIADNGNVNDAFGKLALAGRFQVIQSRHTWVLDVAHNPAAASRACRIATRICRTKGELRLSSACSRTRM